MDPTIDMTRLLAGGGIGVVLTALTVYWLRFLKERDQVFIDALKTIQAEQSATTRQAIDVMSRLDSRAGVVLTAIQDLSAKLDALGERK